MVIDLTYNKTYEPKATIFVTQLMPVSTFIGKSNLSSIRK